MASDEGKDMERVPLYQTEAAKRAVRERVDKFMNAVDYLARYITRDKTSPNIIETKDDLLELENSMKITIPEELVYGAFVSMADTAQKTWEEEKRSVHEMPAITEARKMRAKIAGVREFTAKPISKAVGKRTSST